MILLKNFYQKVNSLFRKAKRLSSAILTNDLCSKSAHLLVQKLHIFSAILGAIAGLFCYSNAYIIILCFAFLFYFLSSNQSVKHKIQTTFLFFFSMHVVSLYWLAYPLTIEIHKHGWLIPLAITLIPLYITSFITIAITAVLKLSNKHNVFAFVFALNIVMFFYGHCAPGFPWVMPAYSWNNTYFLQILSICGVYGLNFLTILFAALIGANVSAKCKIKYLAAALLIFIACLIFGHTRLQNSTEYTNLTARVIQLNISQRNKMDKNQKMPILNKYIEYSAHSSKIDFIIWPEVSIPYLYTADSQINSIIKNAIHNDELIICGAVREDLNQKTYNSIIVVDSLGNNIENYDKYRLVPFGEYVPFSRYFPIKSIANELGSFDTGDPNKVITLKGLKIIPAICYESVFTYDAFHLNSDADLIINLTNDAWFEHTYQPYQHWKIVMMRAIEMGMPLIRCTSYGISSLFDPYGRELAKINVGVAATMDFDIPKKCQEITWFNKYRNATFYLAIAIMLLFL